MKPGAFNTFEFPLFWTVGLSGKRHLQDEPGVATAIRAAVRHLRELAHAQGAALTGISSLARGSDVLFADLCTGDAIVCMPWKCLLPFAWPAFLAHDLDAAEDGAPLPATERETRSARAECCLAKSFVEAEVVCPRADAEDRQDRQLAYLECGYRTVDEADVMILVLNGEEFASLLSAPDAPPPKGKKGGTLAVASYAIASRRPCLLLNADDPSPWENRQVRNEPDAGAWFFDDMCTGVMRHALKHPAAPSRDPMPPGPESPTRQEVWEAMRRLSTFAGARQKRALGGFRWMLSLHLAASAIAALGATVLAYAHDDFQQMWPVLFLGLLTLAIIKPVLASAAFLIEQLLHHHHSREEWLHARVLAETCRGALCTWPLPVQPLDAVDEEDFPKLKRLIRTLRVLRALDHEAETRHTPRREEQEETQLEADMRTATAMYIESRLRDQGEDYYARQLPLQRAREKTWHRLLLSSLLITIALGLSLAVHKGGLRSAAHHAESAAEHGAGAEHAAPHAPPLPAVPRALHHPWLELWRWVEAGVIVGPFVASYALGMITVLDCRRRARRYGEMSRYLARMADTLARCSANPSRLRLIEQAERMMIEEKHEWFSVTRNFSV